MAVLLLLSGYYGRRQFDALRRLRVTRRCRARRPATSGQGGAAGSCRADCCWSSACCWPACSCGRSLRYSAILDQYKGVTDPEYTEAEKQTIRVWGGVWVAILLLLLIVVGLAAADLWSTRGHALRQFRKLQADRRAMIQRQTGRLREERDRQQ